MRGSRFAQVSATCALMTATMLVPAQAMAVGATVFGPDSGSLASSVANSLGDSQTGTTSATTAEASSDWAGWDVTNGNYKSVSANWTTPAVTCASGETSESAYWVGLDGDGSTSVEQTGTQSNCADGIAQYTAWYEFYPAASVNYSNVVKAGDVMTASVKYDSTGTYTLTLTDKTAGWTRTTTGSAPEATNASAEIIAEAPSDSGTNEVQPLSNFGKVTFSDVTVNGSDISSDSSAKAITMASGGTGYTEPASTGENVMATTSALTGGDKFTVTWDSAGSADTTTGTDSTGTGDTGGYGSGGYGSGGYGSGGYGSGYGGGYGSGYGSGYGGGYGSGYGSGYSSGYGYSGGFGY